MPNLGQSRRFLEPCDFEIWRMTLKNNRAPLLSIIKLYASFHHHMWIQTGVTVRKRLSWVVTSVTLTFDLWPWPFAWTSLLSLVITPENFMMIRWWEHSQKGVTDRRTDGQTDGRTDGRTDWTIHRAAWSQLKICTRRSPTSIYPYTRVQRVSQNNSIHRAGVKYIFVFVFKYPNFCICICIWKPTKWNICICIWLAYLGVQCTLDISQLVGSKQWYRDISESAIYRATVMSQNQTPFSSMLWTIMGPLCV